MVCWKIWTWFRIMKISVSSKSFEMHLSFSFAASFCSSVSKSEKLPQMKKSHESNVLRSKAGFSAQMISWVSAARSEKQILSLLRASSSCALERISRSGAVKVVSLVEPPFLFWFREKQEFAQPLRPFPREGERLWRIYIPVA